MSPFSWVALAVIGNVFLMTSSANPLQDMVQEARIGPKSDNESQPDTESSDVRRERRHCIDDGKGPLSDECYGGKGDGHGGKLHYAGGSKRGKGCGKGGKKGGCKEDSCPCQLCCDPMGFCQCCY